MTAKDLKNALLQEAVQGKLVPQIASEGNARDLVASIACLPSFASKTSKKQYSPIEEDEIPFDIPESWCWCKLGDVLSEVIVPQRDKPKVFDGTIPWCRIEDRDGDLLNGTKSNQYVSEKTVKEMNLKIYPIGTVLSASSGASIGSILINTVECCSNQTFIGLVCGDLLLNKYLYYFLHSIIPSLKLMGTGTTLAYISKDKYRQMNFPLPPLAEQKRIVEAIEKFMPLIEEYGKKEAVLKELNANIGTLTKKAILQEAVQGKLVPQIPTEGTAKDLLEQIKSEKAKLIKEGKIKKEKPLPEIMEDEIPFDIPEGWCWCRLGDIVKDFLVPQRDKPKVFDGNIPWCRIEDIEGMFLNGTHSNKYVSEDTVKSMNLKVNPIGTVISANSASIGAAAITTVKCCTNQTFIGLVCSEVLLNYYLYYYLKSITDKLKKMGTGTTISYISQDKYKEMLFPLPPLTEQKRIVAAIEQLLPLCEKLGK